MRIHIVMRNGAPVEAWTDKLWAMRRSAEIGGPGEGHAIGLVTLELRSDNTPESAADNATADADRESRKSPAQRAR